MFIFQVRWSPVFKVGGGCIASRPSPLSQISRKSANERRTAEGAYDDTRYFAIVLKLVRVLRYEYGWRGRNRGVRRRSSIRFSVRTLAVRDGLLCSLVENG